jgi:hypothetical protein
MRSAPFAQIEAKNTNPCVPTMKANGAGKIDMASRSPSMSILLTNNQFGAWGRS